MAVPPALARIGCGGPWLGDPGSCRRPSFGVSLRDSRHVLEAYSRILLSLLMSQRLACSRRLTISSLPIFRRGRGLDM